MLLVVLAFFLLLAILTPLFGYDSRDGYDWRTFDEALRFRTGHALISTDVR